MGIWKRHTGIYKEIAKVDECIRLALKSNQQVLASVNDLLSAGGKRMSRYGSFIRGFGVNNNEES